jgi:putative Holliday junction resolvase
VSAATRLLGVDFGNVRVGLAISDPDRKFAFPLATRERCGSEADAAFYRELVAEEGIGGFVVGLPIHLDGRDSAKAIEARAYGALLHEITSLPVAYWDERFTSVEAESALWQAGLTHKKRKARRDRVAAQIMLQAYLEAGCPTEAQQGPLEG